MTALAPYVQIVARGPGRGRSLTQDEAFDAMRIMLSGSASPQAVGALLMVLRYRGETAAEIAGFTAAVRSYAQVACPAELDWPCYAAGRTRGAPLFLLAARLVAAAGYRVVLHGWNSHQGQAANVRKALAQLDIPVGLNAGPIRYLPLEDHAPQLFALLQLRDLLGLRSCVNTVCRMWNPSEARATVQGVFHPSYRGLQAQAAVALGKSDLSVIKGGGGEFERHPGKALQVYGLRQGQHQQTTAPALLDATRKLHEPDRPVDVAALWFGGQDDPFAEQTVIGTAGLALWTLGAAPSIAAADALAAELWLKRYDAMRMRA
ncbi:glycosyl transferase family protein [Yoonia sp. SS1-5]|uniref:Glycosyl transferase family protein n=1 Tax=Yoonia rhodophyticola TaxID=3137370 RepID=A0AAN0NLI0_9RHOB